MEKCKICNEQFKNLKALTTHTNAKHGVNNQNYYDKYLKKDGEGECNVCGKGTSFRGISNGYLKNCSRECAKNNKEIKRDYWTGKKQSQETILKRIDNTNQTKKEFTRKTTMLIKYGEDNPMKIADFQDKVRIKMTGKKVNRSDDWQEKIINSKRKNGTLKHTKETKAKITNGLNKFYSENLDREKYMSTSNNVNHFCGWYYGLYFRSSLELSFLVQNNNKLFTTCERDKYKISYEKDNKQKNYYPDFTDEIFIYEIKPSTLLNYKDNQIKINRGIEVYGDNFKIITEKECPYIEKTKIFQLIESGIVVVTEKSLEKLKKYRY